MIDKYISILDKLNEFEEHMEYALLEFTDEGFKPKYTISISNDIYEISKSSLEYMINVCEMNNLRTHPYLVGKSDFCYYLINIQTNIPDKIRYDKENNIKIKEISKNLTFKFDHIATFIRHETYRDEIMMKFSF